MDSLIIFGSLYRKRNNSTVFLREKMSSFLSEREKLEIDHKQRHNNGQGYIDCVFDEVKIGSSF